MTKPRIDPIQAGPETDAFWRMIAFTTSALEQMEASGQDAPPSVQTALEGRFRLSYVCSACENEHRVEGDYSQCAMAVQILLLKGARSVMVETVAHALICDAEEADEMVETAKPEDGAYINHRLQEQFFNPRKP